MLNKSWELYKDKFETLIGIAAIPIVANFLILLPLVVGGVLSGAFLRGVGITNAVKIMIAVPLALLAIAWVVLVTLWPAVAMIYAVKEEIGFKKSFKKAWPKIGSYFWVNLLSGLAVTIGMILLIIPGIIFAVWFVLANYALIVEGKKGSNALSRSKELVKGNWWSVFGRILFMGLIGIVVGAVLGAVPLIGPLASNLLLTPFSIVYFFMLYKDLKEEESEEVVAEEL